MQRFQKNGCKTVYEKDIYESDAAVFKSVAVWENDYNSKVK